MYKRSTNKAFAEQLKAQGYFARVGIGEHPEKVVTMTIDECGDVKMLDTAGSEVFTEMGTCTTQRASHVEPYRWATRFWFHLFRTLFGEYGVVGDWTRRWRCLWRVNTTPVGGNVLPELFQYRQDAIAFEVKYLNQFFLGGNA